MKLRHQIKLQIVMKTQNTHLSQIMKKLFDTIHVLTHGDEIQD